MRIGIKHLGFTGLGVVACLLAAFNDPVKTRYSAEELRYFSETAFLPERNIVRWETPILIQLEGSYTSKDQAETDAMISELQPLINIPIKRVAGKGNIVIHYTKSLKEFNRFQKTNEQHPLGYALTEINDDGGLDSVAIYLYPGLLDFKKREVLSHELCHSLGLLEHSKGIYSEHALMTELGNQSTSQARKSVNGAIFPRLDKTAIKLLYDKNLPANMSRQRVLQVVAKR